MDDVRALISERIAQIDAERKRLQAALRELSGSRGSQRPASATTRRSARRQPKSSRARPGERRRQILAHLERNPGARASEIAEAIKASPKHVHSLLSKLRAEKLISRRGKGYGLSARAGSAAKPRPKRSGSAKSAKATAAKTKGAQGKAGAKRAQRNPTTAARRSSAKKAGSKPTAAGGTPKTSAQG